MGCGVWSMEEESTARVEPASRPAAKSGGEAGGPEKVAVTPAEEIEAEEMDFEEDEPDTEAVPEDEEEEDEDEFGVKPEGEEGAGAAGLSGIKAIEGGPDGPPADVESLRRRWETAYPAPDPEPAVDPSPPAIKPDLEWVYGWAARASRSSVKYVGDKIAYPAAGLSVIYDPAAHSQTMCKGHKDDVISLAVHPTGRYVATGERGRWPLICVWDASTGELVTECTGPLQRGVAALTFSGDGTKLAGVGLDDSNTIAVWNWETDDVVWSEKGGGKGHCTGVALSHDGSIAAQVSNAHIQFHWKSSSGVKSRRGLLGRKGKLQQFHCAAFRKVAVGEEALVGTNDGRIYVFGTNGQCKGTRKACKGALSAMSVVGAGGAGDLAEGSVVTAGKDGVVRVWNPKLSKVAEADLAPLGLTDVNVRHVDVHSSGTKVVVGTAGADLVEVDLGSGDKADGGADLKGHFTEEVWGLDTHPTEAEAISAGDDGYVRRWDLAGHKCLAAVDLDGRVRAVSYSPDGAFVAVGMGGRVGGARRGASRRDGEAHDGVVVILNAADLSEVTRVQNSRKPVQDILFSPDGATVAMAAHDSKIYLYAWDGSTLDLKHRFSKHSSTCFRMDFSADGEVLQGCDTSGELLYTDVASGDHILASGDMANKEWATWRCTIGWHVRGAWPPEADGSDVNAMARSRDGQTIATADDFGKVKLFRFPSPELVDHRVGEGHASHVTNVAWAAGDSHIVSAGGNDRCVIQWAAAPAE